MIGFNKAVKLAEALSQGGSEISKVRSENFIQFAGHFVEVLVESLFLDNVKRIEGSKDITVRNYMLYLDEVLINNRERFYIDNWSRRMSEQQFFKFVLEKVYFDLHVNEEEIQKENQRHYHPKFNKGGFLLCL